MASDPPAGCASDLERLLIGLIRRVPDTRSAVLLSSDGLVKAAHGLDADRADHLAALASGLCWLGRSAGVRLCDGGTVRQVVVELDSALLFVSTMDAGGGLAVLTGPAAEPTVLGFEMATLVADARPYLAPPLLRPATGPAAARP